MKKIIECFLPKIIPIIWYLIISAHVHDRFSQISDQCHFLLNVYMRAIHNLYVLSQSQNTPLHVAAFQGYHNIVKTLLAFNAKPYYVNMLSTLMYTQYTIQILLMTLLKHNQISVHTFNYMLVY